MANINYKDILDFNGITTREDILKIDYTTETGRGRFVVFLPDRFPTTAHNIKLFIDMFLKAGNPEETARGLYDYLKKCNNFLMDLRDRIEGINDTEKKDRAALTAAIKKYTANIEVLCKVFNFDTVQDDTAVKMSKVEVVADRLEGGNRKAVNRTGYKFNKGGYTWHVYKENKTCFVIVPCCGLAIANYTGDIKAAPEYITDYIINLMNNGVLKLKAAYDHFMEIIKDSDNIVLNDDIKAPEPVQDTTPATTEEKEPAPAAVPEEKKAAAAPEVVPETPRPTDYTTPPRPVYIALIYYRLFTDQARPEKAHNGIICNNGIIDHRRQKAAYIKPYAAQKRHYITPGYTEVNQTPGQLRSRYGITTALYNRIQAAPPGFQAPPRANIPPYYNTS